MADLEWGYTDTFYRDKKITLDGETVGVSLQSFRLPIGTDLSTWIEEENIRAYIKEIVDGCVDNCQADYPMNMPSNAIFSTFESSNGGCSDVICLEYPVLYNDDERQLFVMYKNNGKHFMRAYVQKNITVIFSEELNSQGFIQTDVVKNSNDNMQIMQSMVSIFEAKDL
jgi:hypothetical protein